MLTLKIPTIKDAETVWRLRNDVATRRELGLNAVAYSECLDWMKDVTSEETSSLFLVEDDKEGVVGFVMFEDTDDVRMIMISIGNSLRGKGYGQRAIKLATEQMSSVNRKLQAHIRSENYKALFAFEATGYRDIGTVTIRQREYFIFEYAGEIR